MLNFFKWLFKKKQKKNIKIGLALGSGGAKGFATLGALRALEEENISFDIIAGTSIGSIIGAFLAKGFSSLDMLELIKHTDFSQLKSFFMINMDTTNIFSLIDENLGSLSFDELKKPFTAVVTDLDSGEERDIDSGNVAISLCASSSYPPFFKPVIIDGKRYIDGAFTNSVPADVVKRKGADYIIGIDLSTKSSGKSLLNMIFPTFEGKVKEPWKKGYEFSNRIIHPNLNDFTSLSIKDGEAMYEIGYEAGKSVVKDILKDLEDLRKQ